MVSAPRSPSAPTADVLTTTDGIRLHHRVVGSGPDTVLIPFDALLGRPFAPLSDDHTLVLYDMRGRGRSDAVAEPTLLGLERDVDDLEAVRRAMGLDRFSLLGYSYLGLVAGRYAARHPERVERLLLLAPLPPRGPHPDALSADEVASLRDPRALEALADLDAESDPVTHCRTWWKTMLPLYLSPSTDAGDVFGSVDLACELPNERPPAFLPTLRAVLGDLDAYDWRGELATVTAPTLVIHGTDDRSAPPAGGREWAEAVSDGRFVAVEDAGHLLWAERPRRVLTLVRDFLARATDTPSS